MICGPRTKFALLTHRQAVPVSSTMRASVSGTGIPMLPTLARPSYGSAWVNGDASDSPYPS